MTHVVLLACAALAAAPAWFDVRAYGARGDGVADDSRAFQAALDAAREAGGGVVHVPAGTWLVAPPASPGGGSRLGSITLGSRVWLRGEGPRTVLRVKPGIGSYRALFSNHPDPAGAVEDVTISDLRVDQDCARSGGEVRAGPQGDGWHAIWLAWAGRRLAVERVVFDAVCGIHTVSLNGLAVRDAAVRGSTFRFVRGPSRAEPGGYYDNTAVYLHGDGLVAEENVFESTAGDGARGAIELHGARGRASGNRSRWYHACARVVGTSDPGEVPPLRNAFEVSGNVCVHARDAINVWSVTGHGIRGVEIRGNRIDLAPASHRRATGHLGYFFGISFAWDTVSGALEGPIREVTIEDNLVRGEPAAGAWGEASGGIFLQAAGDIEDVIVQGNVVRGIPSRAIHLQADRAGARAARVRIVGNTVLDAGEDPAAGAHRAGISLAGRLEDVEVAGNAIVGTRAPFRGRWAVRAVAAAGSARVHVRGNASRSADPAASYAVAAEGAGITLDPEVALTAARRRRCPRVPPRPGARRPRPPRPRRVRSRGRRRRSPPSRPGGGGRRTAGPRTPRPP